jgi:hypothetical protein
MPVIDIDETGIVAEYASVVINVETAYPTNPTIVIPDIYIPDLGNTTVIVIEDRNVLYLDYGTIIIILDKRIVVESRIEGDADIADSGTNTYIDSNVHIEIELTIWINRKSYTIFHKDE